MSLDLGKCYRAQVVSNNYKKAPSSKTAPGSVELMVVDWNADETIGSGTVWAAPMNGAFLGSDSGKYQNIGQCIIPPVGSDVWVAVEDGVYSNAYYMGSVGLANKDTIPYENKQLSNPQDAFTIIKTPKGRAIVVVDDGPDNKGGIVIKGKSSNSRNKVLGDEDQMSIVLSENAFNGISIQTGNGDQFIVINKDANTTEITQGDSRIFMTNTTINIEADTVNIIGRNRINLN